VAARHNKLLLLIFEGGGIISTWDIDNAVAVVSEKPHDAELC
jgi:hypothetical protein